MVRVSVRVMRSSDLKFACWPVLCNSVSLHTEKLSSHDIVFLMDHNLRKWHLQFFIMDQRDFNLK